MKEETQHTMCIKESAVKEIVHAEIKAEIRPMEKDLRSAKNWAIGILLSIIGSIFAIGVWVGSIDNRVSTNELAVTRLEDRLEARLSRIEALLLDLSRNIKN